MNFVKYWPLSTHILKILCGKMGNMLRALLLATQVQVRVKAEHSCDGSELWVELADFSQNIIFTWKND